MDKVLIMCTGDKEAGMSTSKKLLEPLLEEYFIKFPNECLQSDSPNLEIERAFKKACVTFTETSNNIIIEDNKLKCLVGGDSFFAKKDAFFAREDAFFARAALVDNKL